MLLTTIPLFCFISLLLLLGNLESERNWQRAFLRTSLLWGSYSILILEPLSALELISPLSLVIAWIIPTVGLSLKLASMVKHGYRIQLPSVKIPPRTLHRVVLFGICLSMVITFIVAWIAPPQTADSLVYHMSRVAHWAQNQSIKPFATGIRFQNTMSQAAELIILHFYVLAGSDKLATLVQWFAMVGSLIGVSFVALQLGGNRNARLFSAAFAVSLPMGIVQASSTMTDYVLAFWLICSASEVLNLNAGKTRNPISVVYLGLAVGLAIATKPTSFAYLLPFAIFGLIITLRKITLGKAILFVVILVICITALNMGHYLRNNTLYGSPLGFEQTIQRHANELINIKVIVSNTLRHASLHAGTVWSQVNDWIYHQFVKLYVKLGLDINDPRTTFTEFRILAPSTEENIVGNPLHALLILISTLLTFLFWGRIKPTVRAYTGLVILGYVIFSAMFKYQIFGSRLQLPFFILSAPFVGIIFSEVKNNWLIPILGIGLIAASFPWLFQISSRPLLSTSHEPGHESILSVSRKALFLPNAQSDTRMYNLIADRIEEQECGDIGLMLSGSSSEYLWWVFLDAPREDLQLEWIVSDSPTAAYGDNSFEPCAIICENCPHEWTKIRGLSLAQGLPPSRYNLFLEPMQR